MNKPSAKPKPMPKRSLSDVLELAYLANASGKLKGSTWQALARAARRHIRQEGKS